MFEGYCGTSDSGFRAEVESEQALARGEHLAQMIEGHEHSDLRGPAAHTAQRRLQEWGSQFGGAVITDNHQMKRLMRRADYAISPGTFAMCVFDPDKAMCYQQRQPLAANNRPRAAVNLWTAATLRSRNKISGHCAPDTAELSMNLTSAPACRHY